MKNLILLALVVLSLNAFGQRKVTNGTIYIEHPYISAIQQMNKLFAKGDTMGVLKFYADSAKFFDTSSGKTYNLRQTRAHWRMLFANWDNISYRPLGYPDGLKFEKDPFTVQSYWIVTTVHKQTHKKVTFYQVVFDQFNEDGKIAFEYSYFDPSALMAADTQNY